VKLLAYAMGFAEPGFHLAIDFLERGETERMDLIARREMFDLGEAGIFEAAGQDDVADQSIAAEHYGGETHAHLKGDAGFFGNHADGPHRFTNFAKRRKSAMASGVLPERCSRNVMREQKWDWLRLAKGRVHFGHFQSGGGDIAFRAFYRRYGKLRLECGGWTPLFRPRPGRDRGYIGLTASNAGL
jgi:hypothetical protein